MKVPAVDPDMAECKGDKDSLIKNIKEMKNVLIRGHLLTYKLFDFVGLCLRRQLRMMRVERKVSM